MRIVIIMSIGHACSPDEKRANVLNSPLVDCVGRRAVVYRRIILRGGRPCVRVGGPHAKQVPIKTQIYGPSRGRPG